jgi:hypothetical protein
MQIGDILSWEEKVEVIGDERSDGMAMAVIQIGYNSGMLLGALVLCRLVESARGR